jgi:hypothetical protein
MVSQCANPNCQKPLHYLRDGKVFLFSRKNNLKGISALQNLEHFWLCGDCAKQWTLIIDGQNEVRLLERKRRHARRTYGAPSAAAAL